MTAIQYFGIEACKKYGFPYIYAKLTVSETAPDYKAEHDGMADLEKVLSLMRHDGYYPSFYDKAAYLITSIAGSQYFSNGNKRLAVVVLLMFLQANAVRFLDDKKGLQSILQEFFPAYAWEDAASISDGHSLFLYNLAIVIGDRHAWPSQEFSSMKQQVADMFTHIYELEA